MGDWETPGTGAAEPSPETCQEHHPPPPPVHDDALQEHLSHEKQQRQLKRSSLPARPHAAARHTKRLTLNFPINLPPAAVVDSHVSSSPGAMTPVARSSAHQSPVPPVGTPMAFDDQDDGSGLLTAIAAQERKVLELREELQRAESELNSLKKQWAQSEKTKKRTEISHRAEPLLPLRSPDSTGPEPVAVAPQHSRDRSVASSEASSAAPTPSSARYSRELERRQSMLAAATKGTKVSASGRRVFQGSHTRTLSLLSPTSGANTPLGAAETPDGDRIGRSPRSATLPSVERSPMMTGASGDDRDFATSSGDDVITQWRRTMPPPSREALMRTGRQMASDLREGLWTFLEDIRQATVGEEGISATESRAMPNARNKRDSSSASSRSRDRLSVAQGGKLSRSPSSGSKAAKSSSGKDSQSADIDSSFWSEFGIDPPGQTSHPPAAAQPAPRHAQNGSSTDQQPTNTNSSHLDVDDNWDDWDTPQPKKMHTPSSSRSTLESKQDQSPMTQNSSPRTSTSFGDWRQHESHIPDPSVSDGIPWPAITKLAPSKLTRTASNLMAEWERSLSPSPERKVQTRSPPLDKDAKTD
ncbi:hypothetical protein ATEIFO6365_0004032100 [Aspergillus terreus]|uniref:Uncharacterized protein n=1 Tax=Aspergillus terreus TaxID=33178 RepID=A0A5M3YNW7_ASPTE|nr:hypothetical protein ATETN484_0002034600 [Aspergillus terreus]GFF15202.1 hypothetical protein ATEIFO6365_0004032100 [Aspergillus terreus]